MRVIDLLGTGAVLALAAMSAVPANASAAAASNAARVETGLTVLKPKANRTRPLVVVIADKSGVQTTDFIVPYGVLKDSGVVDVRSVGTGPGPITMTRGLRILPDETIAEFDAREAAGADIVIVPAQARPKGPALLAWLKAQAAKGATIIAVCEGSRVLARANLLAGKRAVTHWASLDDMARDYPGTTWVRDRRYVQDGAIITTAGVTASIPMSLALVEAIGGPGIAEATAQRFGLKSWGPAHRTADFAILPSDRAAAGAAQRKRQETTEIPIDDGVDEVALALQTEAWGRSLRTRVLITRPGAAPIRSRHGLVILPDAEPQAASHVVVVPDLPAVHVLNRTLDDMSARYGPAASRFAVLAMEYDRLDQSGN
jgi:putative intracellular protease/amidase